MRSLIYVLFAIVTSVPLSGQEAISEKLLEARLRREKEISEEIKSTDRKYEQELQKILKDAIQRTDLVGAQMVKDQVSSLYHNAVEDLVGTWTIRADSGYTAEVTLKRDGTITRPDANNVFYWFIRGTTLFLGLPDAQSDQFTLPVREGKMNGVNSVRNSLTLTKAN